MKYGLNIVLLFALWVSLLFPAETKAQTDSVYMALDSAVFKSHKHTSVLKLDGGSLMEVDLDALQGYPKILGNTDPLNMLKYFSGVQTSSEYDSGIHIQGCDNAHNYICKILTSCSVLGKNLGRS